MKGGRNVAVTGVAGSGKSNVLHHIRAWLKSTHGSRYSEFVAVTAPTGSAAVNIGGQTLHSVMGCGVPQSLQSFVPMWNDEYKLKLRTLKTLIIDEISLVSGEK